MLEETSWDLIAAAAAGREAERQEFGRRYLPAVRAVLAARWEGSPLAAEVDDAVQEVFLACFREGGALSRADGVERGFRAFLYGITRKVALHAERTRSRRVARVQPGLEFDAVSEHSGLSRVFDREYARTVLREALAVMAARARLQGDEALRRVELLERRFDDGLAVREIARLWRVDGRTLHNEQAKAGREFRSALRQVMGLAERCAPSAVDRECERLLALFD